MAKGVSKKGFRMTKKRLAMGWKPDGAGAITATNAAIKEALAIPVVVETDAEIRAKLSDSFATMEKIAEATIQGQSKAYILSGAPGLGKSFGVMKVGNRLE